MNVVVSYWCKKCRLFHIENTLIGIEHNRYNKTKQLKLHIQVEEVKK